MPIVQLSSKLSWQNLYRTVLKMTSDLWPFHSAGHYKERLTALFSSTENSVCWRIFKEWLCNKWQCNNIYMYVCKCIYVCVCIYIFYILFIYIYLLQIIFSRLLVMTVLGIYKKIIMNLLFWSAEMSLTHSTVYIVISSVFSALDECKRHQQLSAWVQCVCVRVCVWREGLFPRVFVAEFQSVCGL